MNSNFSGPPSMVSAIERLMFMEQQPRNVFPRPMRPLSYPRQPQHTRHPMNGPYNFLSGHVPATERLVYYQQSPQNTVYLQRNPKFQRSNPSQKQSKSQDQQNDVQQQQEQQKCENPSPSVDEQKRLNSQEHSLKNPKHILLQNDIFATAQPEQQDMETNGSSRQVLGQEAFFDSPNMLLCEPQTFDLLGLEKPKIVEITETESEQKCRSNKSIEEDFIINVDLLGVQVDLKEHNCKMMHKSISMPLPTHPRELSYLGCLMMETIMTMPESLNSPNTYESLPPESRLHGYLRLPEKSMTLGGTGKENFNDEKSKPTEMLASPAPPPAFTKKGLNIDAPEFCPSGEQISAFSLPPCDKIQDDCASLISADSTQLKEKDLDKIQTSASVTMSKNFEKDHTTSNTASPAPFVKSKSVSSAELPSFMTSPRTLTGRKTLSTSSLASHDSSFYKSCGSPQSQPRCHNSTPRHKGREIQRGQGPLSPLAQLKSSSPLCAFCLINGEREEHYSSHLVKDSTGKVVCPVLRAHRCELCGATGDQAHTKSYCPLREKDSSSDADSPGAAHRRPRVNQDGFARFSHGLKYKGRRNSQE